MSEDPGIRDHKAWLGYLQPDGLVVSPAALVDAGVRLDANSAALQQRFLDFVTDVGDEDKSTSGITSLRQVLLEFLEWPEKYVAGLNEANPIPESLKIPVASFGETLQPSLALRYAKPQDENNLWILLIEELPLGTDLDVPVESAMTGWSASPTRRFERLLRESQVPIGLQSNGTHFRIVYSPRGENTGTLTFKVAEMIEVAGRPILAAFEMLLSRYRLLAAPTSERLPTLLQKSREYQSRVSSQLAQQVLDALYELLRGFQVAHDHTHGKLLKEALEGDPNAIYGGLLTTLMRLVFLLYAEDRGLMPGSELYVRNYAIHGLFEKLRNDAEQYPDTMDHRYGAWAQLIALFRAVHNGCIYPKLKMPARQGHLFDPQRFPFLEGRSMPETKLPLISDGVVYRVLAKLLLLKGERLSYRTLDVEQIGSVYETMMGFRLETAHGQTIALKPGKKAGAPVPVNLDALAAVKPKDRAKWLQENTDYKLPATMDKAVKEASAAHDLLAALEKRIARNATPQPVPTGTMVLMPTDERRKTGSHYTPRSLTEPIVRTTLEPILKQLGDHPTPEQILDLKVCDPAMGSGAFLVEACRQLADELVAAWAYHGYKPHIPEDEDEILYARRLVAQRCLYGVDRNPMAVDLTKLSLWLATLARDHPFTFLDHALRCGDSLVGLTRKQIAAFDWGGVGQIPSVTQFLSQRIETATAARRQILAAGDDMLPAAKSQRLKVADEALNPVRMAGDACVAAFFSEDKKNKREEARGRLAQAFALWVERLDTSSLQVTITTIDLILQGERTIKPFHWEIEFPEVFSAKERGFDSFIGNPPFLGGKRISTANGETYRDWLAMLHPGASSNTDLVAHFFRRCFSLLKKEGTLGLIATNTIAQGDTRSGGLSWICDNGGIIYEARRRYKWPGLAAVIVSIVHIAKSAAAVTYRLDGRDVPRITSYLFHDGGNDDPQRLNENGGRSFIGCFLRGMGFTFADIDDDPVVNKISLMRELIQRNPKNQERIFPYMGGEEINSNPDLSNDRFVINFGQLEETDARNWPELMAIVEANVLPQRMKLGNSPIDKAHKKYWWRFANDRRELQQSILGLKRVIVAPRVSQYCTFAFMSPRTVFSDQVVVIAWETDSAFTVLQSRIHEVWARFFGSSMKDDLRYNPSDCFETCPFPEDFQLSLGLQITGKEYFEFRAALMVQKNEGLTKTYNRFHDPEEKSTDILKLRTMHDAMDRAVLDAYGWTDLQPTCEFILDYDDEDDEDDEAPRARKKKKPWRYRWPDDLRDEVLARLLKLNAERAEEERRSGLVTGKAIPREHQDDEL